jgi:UDPglucose--hexose-1-phosphate uridylyltransferase
VVPNRFPAVSGARGAARENESEPLLISRAATGVHEVVVETPLHNLELPDRDPHQVTLLLEALQQRLASLQERPSTRQVVIFKNKGIEAGTSLDHPHSQIAALDFVPQEVRRRIQVARRFHGKTGRCLVCTILETERRAGLRIVFQAEGFLAFTPYASASAGEVLLVPLEHAPSLVVAPNSLLARLAPALVRLLDRCRAAFADPPHNLALHTAPKRGLGDPSLHWFWQLSPRLTRTAGFELGTGLRINPLAPEDAASLLRQA